MQNGLFGRSISAFVLAGLLCPSFIGASKVAGDKAAITFQEVGESYVNSFGLAESDKKATADSDKNPPQIDLCPPVLSEHEKRHLFFELMAGNSSLQSEEPSIMDQALRVTLKDLDVLYGSGHDIKKTFVNEINHTSTIFGEVLLAYLLAHPMSDIQKIQNRQAIIKMLVADQDLCDELEKILAQARNAESGFFSYWRQSDPVSEKFFKQMYFSRDTLNTNPYALEAYTRLGNLGTLWKVGGDVAIFVGANYIMAKIAAATARATGAVDEITGKPIQIDETFTGACKATWETAKSFLNPFSYVDAVKNVDSVAGQIADAFDKNGNPMSDVARARTKKFMYGAIALKGLAATAYSAHQVYKTKVAIAEAAQVKNGINYLQTRLIDVASVVDACKKMRAVVAENSQMASGLVYADELNVLFDSCDSADFNQLISLLQTNTFKNTASFFSVSGRVLAAHKLMEAEKDNFAPALAALGEIDACLSVAKLYKKMKNERVGYCFVDFVDAQRPVLEITDFWNPFVDKEVVVTNSLCMGTEGNPSKIILTGSNTGGKSTILKALMMSLLFGHTFGLAPAAQMTATPFAFMGSYLRVNDDTALGESKFKAEVMRAKMLCETMSNLPKDQFGFVVIDELFTGTGSEKAASAAYKVAQKLGALDNNLYILATHFPLLTTLQDESNGLIKNFKVDVYKNEAGALVRPFKLEPGVSSNNIANDILNEQISDINFDL